MNVFFITSTFLLYTFGEGGQEKRTFCTLLKMLKIENSP